MDSRNALVFKGDMISSSEKKKKMEESEEVSSKWTDLPDHINSLIADRLTFPDIFRFGAVCSSWKSISYETRRCRSLSSKPYNPLVLFEYNLRRGTFGFFSFDDNKVYWINLRGAPAVQCVGCSQGWLLMLAPFGSSSYAWNPFTGERITFQTMHNVVPGFEDFSKVMFLSNPLDIHSKKLNNNCTVVDLNSTELKICRLGERCCAVLKLDGHGLFIGSLMLFKGEVYALTTNGELWIINLEGFKPSVRKYEISVDVNISNAHEYQVECYLVEYEEKLLLVVRFRRRLTRRTARFMIYRLTETYPKDSEGNVLKTAVYIGKEVPNLADDQALIIGRLCCKSISTTECQWLQGDSIYFADDRLLSIHEYPEKGIYNLKTGLITPYLPFDLHPFNMPHIWITPSI